MDFTEAALERHQAGSFAMMPPTITVLRNLLEQPDVDGSV